MRFSFIFFNRIGRLRSGWRAFIFVALFFVATMILASAAAALFRFFGVSSDENEIRLAEFAVSSLVILTAALGIGFVCANKIEGLPFRSLGWSLNKGRFLKDFACGVLTGAAALFLTFAVAVAGGLRFALNTNADLFQILKTVFVSACVFAVAAAAEEALFRGYFFQTLTRARMAWAAILLTSVFFSAAHLDNPNVAAYFTFVNTILAGLWFASAYLKTRSLWFPFAMHWIWNWLMGAVLGIPVSGITEITPAPVLRTIENGAAWLSGGGYGLEGGAACTFVLLISIIFVWFAPFPQPSAEMLALTSGENPVLPSQKLLFFNAEDARENKKANGDSSIASR
jgi:membrane protease YdiL (CAAX protease family)